MYTYIDDYILYKIILCYDWSYCITHAIMYILYKNTYYIVSIMQFCILLYYYYYNMMCINYIIIVLQHAVCALIVINTFAERRVWTECSIIYSTSLLYSTCVSTYGLTYAYVRS